MGITGWILCIWTRWDTIMVIMAWIRCIWIHWAIMGTMD